MSVPVHVNVIWDPTVGFNTHTWWCPVQTAAPPPGVPKPNSFNPAFEMIAPQMWTAGYLLGKNKFAKDVVHHSVPICIGDHDLGPLIPDVTIPPPNLWYVIQWPFSGRQMTFTASTVQMKGEPTSCSQLLPPLAMMTCGDPITLPLSFPIINMFVNNVTVGMTMDDYLLGAGKALFSMFIDAIFEFIPFGGEAAEKAAKEALARAAGQTFARNLAEAMAKEALKKIGLDAKSLIKRAVMGLSGLGESMLEGNPTYEIGLGGGIIPVSGLQFGGDPPPEGGTEVFGVPIATTGGNTPTNDPLEIF